MKHLLTIIMAVLLLTTISFAQNKSVELNKDVLNELMEAGGWDLDQASWSVEMWVKFAAFEGDGIEEAHFVDFWTGGAGLSSQLYPKPGLHVLTTAGNGYSFGISGETELLLDTWYHIAIAVDGSTKEATIFLNGEVEASGASDGNNEGKHPNMLDSLVIGHFRGLAYDADWAATRAKFDEVRVWYKALTESEVKANMNSALVSGDKLEAVWNFDDANDIHKDATGNGHNMISGGRVDATNSSDDAPTLTDVVEQKGFAPESFSLSQNYPNPFNPTTIIDFAIAKQSNVTLNVYNAIGQKVAELVNGNMNAGTYEASFDATNLSSGIYFYKLSASNFVSIKKMMLLK